MELLKCSRLKKCYGKKVILNDINLTIQPNKIIGLVGPNGAGKTTLLKLITNLLVPTEGTILINGNTPSITTKSEVAFLSERCYLDVKFTVNYYLNYFKDFFVDFDIAKAQSMLKTMNIEASTRLSTLSKGNLEKVQLALVMSRSASLYILDEPIAGVDPASRDFILKTILNNLNENATLIISTHLISDIETILDEVIFVKDNTILFHKNVDEIREEYNKSIDKIFRELYKNN